MANQKLNAFKVVPMNAFHITGVAKLERECFSSPWSERSLSIYLNDGVAFVALDDRDDVVAYGGLIPAGDECEITNIAVSSGYRRRGLGSAVLDALLDYADRNKIVRVALEVRVSNAPAIALYRSRNFLICGIRRRFYTAPVEDAYTMIREQS